MTERHGALLAALAEDPDHVAVEVDVVHVEAAQLAHPDAGRIEQLQDRHVADAQGTAVVGERRGGLDQPQRLVLAEHLRERAPHLR